MIITIDGPAGSGKSTAARNLARALDIPFLDTGATYRAATLNALEQGADLDDADALAELTAQAQIDLHPDDGGTQVFLDGRDVSADVRRSEVTEQVRRLAGAPQVRAVLVDLQRQIGRRLGRFVTEGRDQGTVVFPDAELKFFLDAGPEHRARRRLEELRQRGESPDYERVLRAIRRRDEGDRTRAVGPLRVPPDAIIVDNSDWTPEQTLACLLSHVRGAGLAT